MLKTRYRPFESNLFLIELPGKSRVGEGPDPPYLQQPKVPSNAEEMSDDSWFESVPLNPSEHEFHEVLTPRDLLRTTPVLYLKMF